MAKGQTASKTVYLNNTKTSTATKTVELVVKDNMLVADNNDVDAGVNSASMKN